jgi:hypothetical protein
VLQSIRPSTLLRIDLSIHLSSHLYTHGRHFLHGQTGKIFFYISRHHKLTIMNNIRRLSMS